MLELYHAHISTCSQKVRLCLAEKGLEWTSHPIEFATGGHLTPAYLALNPNGVVPTLVHDTRPVIDSSVICEYLEEIAPSEGTALLPRDAYGRAKVRAWLRYIEEVPTSAIRVPSFNGLFLNGWRQMSEAQRARYIEATPLRKEHYRRFGTGGFSKIKWTSPPSGCDRPSRESRAQSRRERMGWPGTFFRWPTCASCRRSFACPTSALRMSGATCPT